MDMTIANATNQFRDEISATRAKPTARAYSMGIKHFLSFLKERETNSADPLSNLCMDHFILFPAWLAKQGYSKQTTLVYNVGASSFLDWLVIKGWLTPTHGETLRHKKATKNLSRRRESKLPRTPARDAVDKMLQSVHAMKLPSPIKERDIALIEFLASTGCRVNEACLLKIRDVDLQEHSAKVMGKGSKERMVFLSSTACDALNDYWNIRGFRDKSQPAFARHDDGASDRALPLSTTTMRNVVDEVVAIAGLESGQFTPHSFRHAFATRMLSETGNLALVQDLMGHASPAATRVYAKVAPEELREAHKRVYK